MLSGESSCRLVLSVKEVMLNKIDFMRGNASNRSRYYSRIEPFLHESVWYTGTTLGQW